MDVVVEKSRGLAGLQNKERRALIPSDIKRHFVSVDPSFDNVLTSVIY